MRVTAQILCLFCACVSILPALGYCVEITRPSSDISDFDFSNTDIRDGLRALAEKSGMQLAISSDVSGTVTISLHDVSARDAFEAIIRSQDLAYEKKGEIIHVMPMKKYQELYGKSFTDERVFEAIRLKYAEGEGLIEKLTQIKSKGGAVLVDEASGSIFLIDTPDAVYDMRKYIEAIDMPRKTEIYELRYAKAADVSVLLKEHLTAGVGEISLDERTNKVIVTDLEPHFAKIEEVLKELDVKPRVISVEVKIVELTTDDDHAMGINWTALFSQTAVVTSKFAPTLPGGGTSSFAASLTSGDFSGTMETLQAVGDVDLISQPYLTIMDGEEGVITVGVREAYVTDRSTSTGEGNEAISTTISEAVEFINVGTELYITPHISDDGYITANLLIKSNSVRDTLTTAKGNVVPIVDSTETETRVIAKDGTMIVVAGLKEERRSDTVYKTPYLGDDRALGAPFRNEATYDRIKYTIILMRPRILTSEGGAS